MKRVISVVISVIIALSCAAPFVVYAQKDSRFIATDNEYVGTAGFATREMAVAGFVRAVGMDKLKINESILNKYSDKAKISYTYIDEMSAAVYLGLIGGYEDATLRPQIPITRAEALVVVNRALSHAELPSHYTTTFEDTPVWAQKQINRLAAAGIVKGYGDGRVGANDNLTPEQVFALCERIARATGPCGDFYTYVNSQWLEDIELPDGSHSYSETDRLQSGIDNQIMNIVYSLYRRHYNNGETFAAASAEKKIINVYSAIADQGYRDRLGLAPVEKYLAMIDSSRNIDEVVLVMAELEKAGFSTLLPVILDTNIYDSAQYVPSFSTCYMGVSAEIVDDRDFKKSLSAYKDYIEELFEISGSSQTDADYLAELSTTLCYSLLDSISKMSKAKEIDGSVRICTVSEVAKIYSNIDIKKYLSAYGYGGAKKVQIYNEELAKEINKQLKPNNLETIKAYLKASVLDSSALYLTADTFEACESYREKQTGMKSDLIPSDYAVYILQEMLGWELGKIYIDAYFPETIKPAVEDLTAKIIAQYEMQIKNSVGISPQERSFAIAKLKNLKVNIAFPDDISGYEGDVVFRPISEGGNLMEYKILQSLRRSENCAALFKSKKRADRGGWKILPQSVNAMYDPATNSVTVPAGLLQSPYFDQTAEFEENLGSVGVIIAHEISHAFDSAGIQFDEKGSLIVDKAERQRLSFEGIYRKTVGEYNKLIFSGAYIDGSLTERENFADLAGMSCVIGLAGAENPKLGLVFESYARSWRTKTTKKYDRETAEKAVHSPASIRVNRVLSNFKEFEGFYGVIDGDGMFIPDADKINIWK